MGGAIYFGSQFLNTDFQINLDSGFSSPRTNPNPPYYSPSDETLDRTPPASPHCARGSQTGSPWDSLFRDAVTTAQDPCGKSASSSFPSVHHCYSIQWEIIVNCWQRWVILFSCPWGYYSQFRTPADEIHDKSYNQELWAETEAASHWWWLPQGCDDWAEPQRMRNHDTGEEQETGQCGWRESRELRHGWHEADLGLAGLSGQAMATGATASPEPATQQRSQHRQGSPGRWGWLRASHRFANIPGGLSFPRRAIILHLFWQSLGLTRAQRSACSRCRLQGWVGDCLRRTHVCTCTHDILLRL